VPGAERVSADPVPPPPVPTAAPSAEAALPKTQTPSANQPVADDVLVPPPERAEPSIESGAAPLVTKSVITSPAAADKALKKDVPKGPAKAAEKPSVPAVGALRTNPAVAPGPIAAPPLDLKGLETRLKETPAIGFMTKLSLKNQVDDLMERFRAFYQGRLKTSLAELRQPYEGLILKVISLLQNADPALARAVAQSRDAIWELLADPVKFSKL
jgi:hypothetical protein